jgi:citrate lyase beta subunit
VSAPRWCAGLPPRAFDAFAAVRPRARPAAIHPAQVEIINRCFTPTDAEPSWVERVLAAFGASTFGVMQIDAVMLDAPHRAQARRIMAPFVRG